MRDISNSTKAIIAVVVLIILGGIFYFAKSSGNSYSNNQPSYQQTASTNPTYQAPSSSPAQQGSLFMMENNPKGGTYVADSKGMALYTFDKDKPGVSNCTGQCLTNWPPFTATMTDNLPSGYGVITRSDGTKQYTLNSMPLYYYAGDKNPGDTNGDGVGGIWHLAK